MAYYGVDVINIKVIKDGQVIPFEGIFELLKSKSYFDLVQVNSEIGTTFSLCQ